MGVHGARGSEQASVHTIMHTNREPAAAHASAHAHTTPATSSSFTARNNRPEAALTLAALARRLLGDLLLAQQPVNGHVIVEGLRGLEAHLEVVGAHGHGPARLAGAAGGCALRQHGDCPWLWQGLSSALDLHLGKSGLQHAHGLVGLQGHVAAGDASAAAAAAPAATKIAAAPAAAIVAPATAPAATKLAAAASATTEVCPAPPAAAAATAVEVAAAATATTTAAATAAAAKVACDEPTHTCGVWHAGRRGRVHPSGCFIAAAAGVVALLSRTHASAGHAPRAWECALHPCTGVRPGPQGAHCSCTGTHLCHCRRARLHGRRARHRSRLGCRAGERRTDRRPSHRSTAPERCAVHRAACVGAAGACHRITPLPALYREAPKHLKHPCCERQLQGSCRWPHGLPAR
jgi:hypothetical protein